MRAVAGPLQQLEQLQRMRGPRRERDASIGPLVRSIAQAATRHQRRLGDLVALWERHVPAPLAERTAVVGFRAGVLQVAVESPAVHFEIDQLLRGGLVAALRSDFKGTLIRVRLRVGTS
jgi:hypothetical protein